MKKVWTILLLLATLLSLIGCAAGGDISVPDRNGDGKLTCTLEIRCDTLLAKRDTMQAEKAALVPADGVLLETVEVEFEPGDAVFDVFRRVLREKKLHFEYTDGRAYDAVYIEGICNLYEFDCGPQSGWMYSVNDVYPSLGCSAYTLSDGDAIAFHYTCDLGADLGAERPDA